MPRQSDPSNFALCLSSAPRFTRSLSFHLSFLCGFNPSHVQDIVMYAIIPEGWLTGERRRENETTCTSRKRDRERKRETETETEGERTETVYRDGNDNGPNLTHSSTSRPRLPFQKTIVLEKPTLSCPLQSVLNILLG